MKNLFLLLSFVFLFANITIAQGTKKATQPKAAATPSVSASPPKLDTKEPSFVGFTGSFVKFGKMSGASRSFTMTVEYKPWFFEVKGNANADHNTEDLDVLLEDVVGVVAYYNATGKTADGTTYQAGLFDFMMYLDDEPVKISNVSFTLTGKASAGSSVLTQAKTWNFEAGKVFKTQKYSSALIKAQASAMDKSDIAKEEAAAKKRVADSIAKEEKRVSDSIAKAEKRVADSIAKVEKRKRDSIATEKKRVADSIAEAKELAREAREKAKKEELAKKKAAEKKRKAVEDDDIDDDDYEPPKKKKKRPQVEDDDDEPVKKKKKKRPVVEEDDDDEPPPKKKAKKRRDD